METLQLLMLLEVKHISFLTSTFIEEVNFPRSQLFALQIGMFSVSLHTSLHGSVTHGGSSRVFNLSAFKTSV